MKKISILFLALLLFAACGEEKKQIENLKKETNALHDKAMKDVADMNRVARHLKELMLASTMTPVQSAAFTDALTAMGKAENNMNDWMAKMKNSDEMPTPEALKYLQAQKSFLEKNGQDIRTAMEAGKKLIPAK